VIRAVIDTNVVVSGLLSPAGNEALILLAIHQGLVRPCFSEEMLEEYAGVLARPKFAFPADEIAALLAMFRNRGELIMPKAVTAVSVDPGEPNFCSAPRRRRPITSSLAISGISRKQPMA
jgi:uncharacterized protein